MDYKKVVPAIAAFLWDLSRWEIPKKIIPPEDINRWGFKTYENPEIVEMLSEDQPDTHVHNFIQSVMEAELLNEIKGPASDFFKFLEEHDARGVNDLKLTSRSLAKHFEKLKERFPHIYQCKLSTWKRKKGMKVFHAVNETNESDHFQIEEEV